MPESSSNCPENRTSSAIKPSVDASLDCGLRLSWIVEAGLSELTFDLDRVVVVLGRERLAELNGFGLAEAGRQRVSVSLQFLGLWLFAHTDYHYL